MLTNKNVIKQKSKRSMLYHQAIVLLPSALPSLLAINLVSFLVLLVSWYNPTNTVFFLSAAINNSIVFLSFIFFIEILIVILGWFYDMYVESALGGYYTSKVRKNLRHGFYAFIISEAMLFFSFFWAYFHSAISPTVQIGSIWPPLGIPNILTTGLPLLGTFILVLSGISVTWANKAIVLGGNQRLDFGIALFTTILLGFIFLILQALEYCTLKFSFNDSVLGSCFYMLTGFHGFHVFLGLIFLIISYWLFYKRSLTQTNYVFLELSILYWHFVDLIWIALFFIIYCWGFGGSFIQQTTTYLEPNIFIAVLGILPKIYKRPKRILEMAKEFEILDGYKLQHKAWLPINYRFDNIDWCTDKHLLELEIEETKQICSYTGPDVDNNPIEPNLFFTQDGFTENGAFFFQKPFTDSAREIISFHSYLLTLIIILAVFVFWLLLTIVIHFKEDMYDRNILPSERPYIWERTTYKAYGLPRRRKWKRRFPVNYNVFQLIEFWWTVIPGLIILGLSIASLLLLYSWDTGLGISLEGRKSNILQNIMIKVKGSQWFWTYEFSNPQWSLLWCPIVLPDIVTKVLSTFNVISQRGIKFESHLAEQPSDRSSYLGNKNKTTSFYKTLLSTTGDLNLPVRFIIKLIVTSSDVIHSWAIPSFGVKVDAIPGRANVQSILIHSIGNAYGQCSEICGIKHAFMPISINTMVDIEWSSYYNLISIPKLKISLAGKSWYQNLVGTLTRSLYSWEALYDLLQYLKKKILKDTFLVSFYVSVNQEQPFSLQYIFESKNTKYQNILGDGYKRTRIFKSPNYNTSKRSHIGWFIDYGFQSIVNNIKKGKVYLWLLDSLSLADMKYCYIFFITTSYYSLRSINRQLSKKLKLHKPGPQIISTGTVRYLEKPTKKSREALEKPGSRDIYKAELIEVPTSSLKTLNELHSYWYTTPGNLGNAYALGFLLMFGIIIQILTGMLLVANYEPTISGAFESVQWIRRDIVAGYLVQSTHAIGASILFIALYLHIFRGLYLASYQKKSTWITGICIYFLIALIAFLGYCLPWGQMSLWGCKVITSFLTAIPYIGFTLVEWVWGGPSINDETLKRFYMLHIILNAVLLFLIGLHIRALHKEGSSSPLCTIGNAYIDFFPYIPIKDTLMVNTYLVLLLSTIIYDPNLFSHPENFNKANPLVTPDQIVPEWYFLPFYAILRSIPSKTGGLLAMLGAILVWAVLPWLAGPYFKGKWDPISIIGYGFNVSTVLLLGWLGAQPLREPFLSLASACTWVYFFYFLAFIPFFTRRRTVRFFPTPKFRYYFQFFPTMTFKEGMIHYGLRTLNWWKKNGWDWIISFKNTPFNH